MAKIFLRHFDSYFILTNILANNMNKSQAQYAECSHQKNQVHLKMVVRQLQQQKTEKYNETAKWDPVIIGFVIHIFAFNTVTMIPGHRYFKFSNH